MGDPSKIILLEAVLETIRKENLLHRVTTVGDYILKKLMNLQNEFSTMINSVRGRGTFIAFNCASPELRDAIIKKLLSKGNIRIICIVSLYMNNRNRYLILINVTLK